MQEPDQLIGESPSFLDVLRRVSETAVLDKPILIVGERGTGKELIAARLHQLSRRWDETSLQLNCAALSEDLLESELFGHEQGAFTGATKRHLGRFERAHLGTLFMDELGTTSLRVQEKILRVIEYGQFERLGGNQTLTVDVRLIAATNQDLPQLAKEGKFREDLLDRLAFDVVTLPPLRSREEDIPLLAHYFAEQMAQELDYEYFHGFSESAMQTLLSYEWPGNLRELKNVVERSVYRAGGEMITEVNLDPFDSPYRPVSSRAETETTSARASIQLPVDLNTEVGIFEIELITQALESVQHNQGDAAKLLGLSYHQLRHRMKKHNVL